MNPFDCFNVSGEASFQQQALSVFQQQAACIPVYRDYLKAIRCDPDRIQCWEDIPYLPVSFFKTHHVCKPESRIEMEFFSSGTGGQQTSRHPVHDIKMYEESFLRCFRLFYGEPSAYCILALLPSYLERSGSSLVFMAEQLIRLSENENSGFYLHQYEQLAGILKRQREKSQKTILLGVSYALLDLAEQFPVCFPDLIVMETGGMKGRKREMVREELHQVLCRGFGVRKIHSEYGMTELLSQAYSAGEGRFYCPLWMRIRIREINDPFVYALPGRTGGICITDLANAHSCSFLAVDDLGRQKEGYFEVLGRYDTSDLRGCNLMVV